MSDLNNMTPRQLAEHLDANRSSAMVNHGTQHCAQTCDELRKLGWRYRETHSCCMVATYEDSLEKDGYVLHAISAYFYGAFCDYSLLRLD